MRDDYRDPDYAAESEYQRRFKAAVTELTHQLDGPVTKFVVLARAVRLAREQGPYVGACDPIANALHIVLEHYLLAEEVPDWV